MTIKYFIILFILIVIILNIFQNKYKILIKENLYDSENYMHPPTCYNDTLTYNIPTLDYIQKNTVINVKNILYYKRIEEIFKPYILKNQAALENIGEWVKLNYNIQNQNTWENKLINLNDNINISYKLDATDFDDINKSISYINKIVENEFIIYKYALSSIYVNDKLKEIQFGILAVLLQEFGFYGYTIFLKIRINKNTKFPEITEYKFVGQFYTDKLLGYSGYNKNIDNIAFVDKDISFQKSGFDLPIKSETDISRCFNPQTNITTKDINREICTAGYDAYGRKKQVGVWDKPCKKNEDCIFYKGNQNYDNKFGGCINGFCEMPINVKRIGYTLYDTSTKPLCYNCDTKDKNKWLPISGLGDCCDKQAKNNVFNSPDYAFDNDIDIRFNKFLQDNYDLLSIVL